MKKLWNLIVNEPAVTLGLVLAVATTAAGADWKGYVAAAATALLRFVVSPATTA